MIAPLLLCISAAKHASKLLILLSDELFQSFAWGLRLLSASNFWLEIIGILSQSL